MIAKTNKRNAAGVKSSIDLYRTFNGAHYESWMSFPSAARIAAYRAAGIRCRRLGVELFVHHMDIEAARRVDREQEALKT